MKQHIKQKLVVTALVLVTVFNLAVGVAAAQEPQEPELSVQLSFTPSEVPIGDRLAGAVTIRNEGTTPAEFDVVVVRLPDGAAYVGQAAGSDFDDVAQVKEGWLLWSGPFDLLTNAEFTIRYWLVVSELAAPGDHTVQATARKGDQTLASAESPLTWLPAQPSELAPAEPAQIDTTSPSAPQAVMVIKDADPETVQPGMSVAYSVTFSNSGQAVDLDTITDDLPSSFKYVGLAAGSDITEEPTDSEAPRIVWTGPYEVPAGGTLTLRYWVRVPLDTPSSATPYANRVTATSGSSTFGPARADVRVKKPIIYFPFIIRTSKPATTLPFEDSFDQGLSSNWVKFLNYPGLNPAHWVWEGGQNPAWGWYRYNPYSATGALQWNGFALSMYLGPGAQEWTDYQAVTTMRARKGKLAGLWVRGTYENLGDMSGRRVGGYYVHIRPDIDTVFLWRIDPASRMYSDADVVAESDDFNPDISATGWYDLKVTVQGATIKVYLREARSLADEGGYQLLINWTDPNQSYMKGTVGFTAYRTDGIFNYIKVTPLESSSQSRK
jgi:uncharacterized repeat protein (TIGR01451 family)